MGRHFVAILLATGLLSVANILIIRSFPTNSFLYFFVFLLNAGSIVLITSFFNKNGEEDENEKQKNNKIISERSVSIFIRLLIYILPIVALIGLYLVSVMDNKFTLGIEDANSWVSFILGIAAFVMSLITLWQSEGTYTRIFDALDEIGKKTDHIKTNTDVSKLLFESNNKKFIEELEPFGEQSHQAFGFQTSNQQSDENQKDEMSIKSIMHSSHIFKQN